MVGRLDQRWVLLAKPTDYLTEGQQTTQLECCYLYMRLFGSLTVLLVFFFFSSCQDDGAIPQTQQKKDPVFIGTFEVTNSSIPVDEIREGGPPKDGIPAIDEPQYISADRVDFLKDSDLVLGIVRGNRARAYPTRILDWHEIVNDSMGDEDLLITYCPLCGSGMAFAGSWAGERRTFGVSGVLYNSDVLLYDRKTESLWSQIKGEAVTGVELGTKLKPLGLQVVPWKTWKSKHPNTEVLSKETGWDRDYDSDAYDTYRKNNSIWFPISASSNAFPNKEWVLGIEQNGRYKAYAFSELKKSASDTIVDFFNGQKLRIIIDRDSETGAIYNEAGVLLPHTRLYWFAWYAFHEDTQIYRY